MRKEAEKRKLLKQYEEANRDRQLLEDKELDDEENKRNALVQDVINEAEETGRQLSPSVKRLLQHLKGNSNQFLNVTYIFLLKILFNV